MRRNEVPGYDPFAETMDQTVQAVVDRSACRITPVSVTLHGPLGRRTWRLVYKDDEDKMCEAVLQAVTLERAERISLE